MTVFNLPQGSRLAISIYLTGKVWGEQTFTKITLSGLRAFSSDVLDTLNIEPLVKTYKLDELGTDWRVMTDEEIVEYLRDEAEDEMDPSIRTVDITNLDIKEH